MVKISTYPIYSHYVPILSVFFDGDDITWSFLLNVTKGKSEKRRDPADWSKDWWWIGPPELTMSVYPKIDMVVSWWNQQNGCVLILLIVKYYILQSHPGLYNGIVTHMSGFCSWDQLRYNGSLVISWDIIMRHRVEV